MTTLPPLHVILSERTPSGFNNQKDERMLAEGEVAFNLCLEELLLIASTPPPNKPEIVAFEKESLTIALNRYGLFDGMQPVDTPTAGHKDFGYTFRVRGHWELSTFELFAQNVAALSNLFRLIPQAPMSGRIEAITEECHARTFGK